MVRMVEVKRAALECRRSQFGPDNPFQRLPEEVIKEMMSREYFVRAWPETAFDEQLTDLFAGL